MTKPIALLIILMVCFPSDNLMGNDTRNPLMGPLDYSCEDISPSPGSVTEFYENNPTYRSNKAETLPWAMVAPEKAGMSGKKLQQAEAKLAKRKYSRSLLVIRNQSVVWEAYLNGGRADQSHNIHSSSKSMLSAMVGIALNHGLLKNLDQLVSQFLPELQFPSNKKDLKIKHLLQMTSGITWEEDQTEYEIENDSNWGQSIINLPQAHTPGKKFHYSTGNTHLLSAVLTRATGFSTCQFAHMFLFKPLGITVQRWGRDPQGFYSGGYNLYMSPRAMAKFGMLYLQHGNWNGTQVIPASWVTESTRTLQKVDGTFRYGNLWWLRKIQGYEVIKAWGYGGQFIYVVPGANLVVVMTAETKSDHNEPDGDEILNDYILPAIIN